MDTIYVIMLVFMTGLFCVLSFLIGVLSALGKSRITLNPVEAYKEHKEQKQQQEEHNLQQKQLEIMLENIENYDGTSTGQKDIPNE